MAEPEKKLKEAGLDVKKVKIDTGGSVEKNAALIKFEIDQSASGKKFVIIGHSKVDLAEPFLWANRFVLGRGRRSSSYRT
jgi:hypothetical protein